MENLLVFSHLRWDFVYQRPQHLMSRLARHYRIVFFEEPVYDAVPPWMEILEPQSNVLVCRPHTPIQAAGFHDDQVATLRLLLADLMRDLDVAAPIAWLYTPMALPLMQDAQARLLVYDCMDELSGFRNAPRQLLQRESALLRRADLVFTGGPSLYRAKQPRHPAVYCFPSSVERTHFAAAADPAIEHPLQADLQGPKLGFFGVIDERFDIPLLSRLADSHPEWALVMVGPVVKIDPAALPRNPNIHYFGQRTYEDLPKFLAGWDVCLLPFALNEATRFISPTKTLEYMAAGKPVVSTPVPDVAQSYPDVVRIAQDEAFVTACERALSEAPSQAEQRRRRMREIVETTSWDSTAERMHELMRARTAGEATRTTPKPMTPAVTEGSRRVPVVIIGAGPTGLSAAYHLGTDSILLDQNPTVGGWCRSVQEGGFTFDYAGHIMFSNDPYVHQMYDTLLGDNVHWQNREAWIFNDGVYTRYPFQGALYGLPPEVISECIMGAIEARMGPLDRPATPAATGSSSSECKAESITDCCADGLESIAPARGHAHMSVVHDREPRNFEEFIFRVWGKGVAKHFALPYNRKLWAVPLREMETSWLGGRVPMPDLQEMIEGALRPVGKPMGPNARFGYPLKGGFQALMNGFTSLLRGELRLNARVDRVVPKQRQVVMSDGSSYGYEQLISTMPLPALVLAMGDHVPPEVARAAAELRHVSVRCVNLGIGRTDLTDKHWIYYPGASVFHRIFVQGNASPHVNAPGGFALTCEITYSASKPLPCDGEALIDRCIRDCIDVGIIREDDPILVRNQVDMPYAYVVYDHSRAANVSLIRDWAQSHGIILAGRYSEWEYYNSDHAFLAGRKAAEKAQASLQPRKASVLADSRQAASAS